MCVPDYQIFTNGLACLPLGENTGPGCDFRFIWYLVATGAFTFLAALPGYPKLPKWEAIDIT